VKGTGRAIAATLAIGLVALAAGLALTLSHSAVRRTGTDGALVSTVLLVTGGNGTVCQPQELAPAGTGAIGLSLKAVGGPGPHVAVDLARGHAVAAHGVRAAGWRGEHVVVPLRRELRRDVQGSVCVTLGPHATTVLGGERTPRKLAATTGDHPLPGRLRIEYLRPRPQSWWSFAGTIVHRIGVGRGPSGPWAGLLAIAFAFIAIGLSAWQLTQRSA